MQGTSRGQKQSPLNSAVHNKILMQPWCSRWCQCFDTAQAKADVYGLGLWSVWQPVPEGWRTQNYLNTKSNMCIIIVQELCESRGGRPGLSVLMSLLVSVDVKNYCTVLRHWSQLVPNMSTDI